MIGLLLLLVGCTFTMRFPPPENWGDSADSGLTEAWFEPVHVTEAEVACDPSSNLWSWHIQTNGWTRSVVLDIEDTSDVLGWEEEHDLRMVETHPQGRWERLALGPIPGGTPMEQWEPNNSTVFDCVNDKSKLTFAIRVWNLRDDLTDCIVWGHDPDELVSRLASDREVATYGSCLVLSTPNDGSSP